MSYPVGIVPPRTKSPVPDSSSIASYVTLRKSRKPDPRTVRPWALIITKMFLAFVDLDHRTIEKQTKYSHDQDYSQKKTGVYISAVI